MFNEEIFNLNIDNIKNDLYRQFANNEIDMPQLINEIKKEII